MEDKQKIGYNELTEKLKDEIKNFDFEQQPSRDKGFKNSSFFKEVFSLKSLAWIVVVFVAICLILITLKPLYVMKKNEKSQLVLNPLKVLQFGLLFEVVVITFMLIMKIYGRDIYYWATKND